MSDVISWENSKKYVYIGGTALALTVGVGLAFGLWRHYVGSKLHVSVLFDEDYQITEEFRSALKAVFRSYDRDGDGVLNRDEVNQISLDTEERPLTDLDWSQLPDHYDVDEDGSLTVTGFISMVQDMADTAVAARSDGRLIQEHEALDGIARDMKAYGISYAQMFASNA